MGQWVGCGQGVGFNIDLALSLLLWPSAALDWSPPRPGFQHCWGHWQPAHPRGQQHLHYQDHRRGCCSEGWPPTDRGPAAGGETVFTGMPKWSGRDGEYQQLLIHPNLTQGLGSMGTFQSIMAVGVPRCQGPGSFHGCESMTRATPTSGFPTPHSSSILGLCERLLNFTERAPPRGRDSPSFCQVLAPGLSSSRSTIPICRT